MSLKIGWSGSEGLLARTTQPSRRPTRSLPNQICIRLPSPGHAGGKNSEPGAAAIIDRGGRLAVFGAGHRACTLIDIMELAEFIDCVIDDSPEKQKLRFPAGGLSIRGSRALIDHQITCCLMGREPRGRTTNRRPKCGVS